MLFNGPRANEPNISRPKAFLGQRPNGIPKHTHYGVISIRITERNNITFVLYYGNLGMYFFEIFYGITRRSFLRNFLYFFFTKLPILILDVQL